MTWKTVGPRDPFPLEGLEHANNMPGPDGRPLSRPGYSLPEASALMGVSAMVQNSIANRSLSVRVLQKNFALWGRYQTTSPPSALRLKRPAPSSSKRTAAGQG